MISDFDKAHVHDILNGYGDWFTAKLLRLIDHADKNNRELLRKAYPEVVQAYDDWYYGKSQDKEND